MNEHNSQSTESECQNASSENQKFVNDLNASEEGVTETCQKLRDEPEFKKRKLTQKDSLDSLDEVIEEIQEEQNKQQ